jgi:protein-disulfide isomerase
MVLISFVLSHTFLILGIVIVYLALAFHLSQSSLSNIFVLLLFLSSKKKFNATVNYRNSSVSSGRDHIQGRTSAPVTLIEYGDYECPYCGQAYPIIKEVQKQLGNKLRFVFRNFPLSKIHPHEEHAAEAAEAAAHIAQNRMLN